MQMTKKVMLNQTGIIQALIIQHNQLMDQEFNILEQVLNQEKRIVKKII